jgi:redox-sensitive bicupin YhaK (pirin superfamily)
MRVQTQSKVFHGADSRGVANHGWLVSRHTFSFASYYNPDRVHFGALRVLNDDIVAPGKGFGTHPHDNMEIISIPLRGSLAHKDSIGIEREIRTGEVQIMSAGSGIQHSEYNYSDSEEVNFLQIWILPKEKNIAPRYDQKDFNQALQSNEMVTVVSPKEKDALWINQNAVMSLGHLIEGSATNYKPHFRHNSVYAFLIDGTVQVNETTLAKRDAVGYYRPELVEIKVERDAQLLLIEVPELP